MLEALFPWAALVGHSAGGTVALLTVLTHPEQVEGLVLVDAAVYRGGGTPGFLRPLLNSPQMRRVGPLLARRIGDWGMDFARSAWHETDKITPEVWEGYQASLKVQNWDRALWELTRASHALNQPEPLEKVEVGVLVVIGNDDRIVPTEHSVGLEEFLCQADQVVIPDYGHVPQEECPDPFLRVLESFLSRLP